MTGGKRRVASVIHARWVVPIADLSPEQLLQTPEQSLEHHSVVVDDNGVILDILPIAECEAKYSARETVDLSASHCIMPGLINAHTHSGMTMFRG